MVAAYVTLAIIFVYFAEVAATALRHIPAHLFSRRKSTLSLRILGYTCIFALLAKAFLYIALAGLPLDASSLEAQAFVALYYTFLEICPVGAILLFYKVDEVEEDVNFFESSYMGQLDDSHSNAYIYSAAYRPQSPKSAINRQYSSPPSNKVSSVGTNRVRTTLTQGFNAINGNDWETSRQFGGQSSSIFV